VEERNAYNELIAMVNNRAKSVVIRPVVSTATNPMIDIIELEGT
jgi:hypothetical protein